MIDLKQLEKQLDDALNNETKESLTSWLLNRRAQNEINKILENINLNLLIQEENNRVTFVGENITPDNTSYALAA